jgi:hypothetical protein
VEWLWVEEGKWQKQECNNRYFIAVKLAREGECLRCFAG